MEYNNVVRDILLIFSQFKVVSIFLYGNFKGKDVDVFVLLDGSIPYMKSEVNVYDITAIGEDWIPMLVRYRDPLVIEPVLGGSEIYGSISDSILSRLSSSFPDPDCPDFLRECSSLFFSWAVIHERDDRCLVALETLRFALSYALLAKHYEASREICRFSNLLESSRPLMLINNSIKRARPEDTSKFIGEIGSVLTEFGVLL